MKSRVVQTLDEACALESQLGTAASAAVDRIAELASTNDPLTVLRALKFERAGRDPLDHSRPLNLIEQLNQTFTYLVSVRAIEFLFEAHPEAAPFRLNLGTAAGSDVESVDGSVAAEVFAAVRPNSNNKLRKDIEKVSQTSTVHRYVFFYCPGTYERHTREGVTIVPVSLDRQTQPAPQSNAF